METCTLENLRSFEEILAENADKYQALIDKANQEFSNLLPRFSELLNLKETVRAQAAEIERLNIENNVLIQKLTAASIERDEAVYTAQQAQLQVAAFQNKNEKLLEIVHLLKGNGGNIEDLFVASFELPHNGSKKAAIGMLGRKEMIKEDRLLGRSGNTIRCTNCRAHEAPRTASTGEEDEWIAAIKGANSGLPEDLRHAPYEARIRSLEAERNGIIDLYTARISELQASLERVRATLSERAEKAENELDSTTKELVRNLRRAGDLEARVLHLESNLATLAAKGTLTANRVREEAEQAIRDARRELRVFEINKQKEIKTVEKKAKQTISFDNSKLKERIAELETINAELSNKVLLTEDRLHRCERKLRDITTENALVRESLRNLHSSGLPSLALTGITKSSTPQSSLKQESTTNAPSIDLLSVCSGGSDWVTMYEAYNDSSMSAAGFQNISKRDIRRKSTIND